MTEAQQVENAPQPGAQLELPGYTLDEGFEFTDSFRVQIDSSRRIVVPVRWRPPSGEEPHQVILWPIGAGTHLKVLPQSRWKVIRKKIALMCTGDMEPSALRRTLGQTSKPLELDKAGRFTLTETMLKCTGITKEALLLGCIDYFEIWDPARYEAQKPVDFAVASKQAERMEL